MNVRRSGLSSIYALREAAAAGGLISYGPGVAGMWHQDNAWISHCRRPAKDFERHARKAAAFIRLAMIRIMLRRIAANPST